MSADPDIAEVRDVLRANGVIRYGRFERTNTPGALAALARVEARLEAAEKALLGAQFFLHAMKDTIIATDSTGEGQEIAGELLSEMESLLGPYEAGKYVRALAGKDAG